MKLDVVDPEPSQQTPWYSGGLKFTCTQCGNCCTGAPGYVWISQEEIESLAKFLNITTEETVEKYCRRINGRFSLKEIRSPVKQYDCIFLKEVNSEPKPGEIGFTKRICTVYPVRPLQCRTWPFWDSNMQSKAAWNRAARNCHGMNHGKTFSRELAEQIRDARDIAQLDEIVSKSRS